MGNRPVSSHTVKFRCTTFSWAQYFYLENLLKKSFQRKIHPHSIRGKLLPAMRDSRQLPGVQLHQLPKLSTTFLTFLPAHLGRNLGARKNLNVICFVPRSLHRFLPQDTSKITFTGQFHLVHFCVVWHTTTCTFEKGHLPSFHLAQCRTATAMWAVGGEPKPGIYVWLLCSEAFKKQSSLSRGVYLKKTSFWRKRKQS